MFRMLLGLLVQWGSTHNDPNLRRSAGIASIIAGLFGGESGKGQANSPASKYDWFKHFGS